jgi:hypothetical protein
MPSLSKHPEMIRAYHVSDLVETLIRSEKSLGVGTTEARRFVKLGSWLIEINYFFKLLRFGLLNRTRTPIPHFSLESRRKRLSKVLRSWSFFGNITAPLSANAICVGNNLRTFYLDLPEPFSAKIAKGNGSGPGNLHTDVEARNRVLAHGVMKVPRILRSGMTGDCPYLAEEIIYGRHPHPNNDKDLLLQLLNGPYWENYVREGFHFSPICNEGDRDDSRALLEQACSTCFWRDDWLPKDALISKAVALLHDGGLLTCSIGHGDFKFHNVIVTDDKVPYLIDWEHSREMPLMNDLLKPILDIPGAFKLVEKRMAALPTMHQGEPVLSFRQQLLVAVFQAIMTRVRSGAPSGSPAGGDRHVSRWIDFANRIFSMPDESLQPGLKNRKTSMADAHNAC